MKRFSDGKTNIMVATTVIEVGWMFLMLRNDYWERWALWTITTSSIAGRVGRGADQIVSWWPATN
jgi:ATP-dependent DNA helicase RecG